MKNNIQIHDYDVNLSPKHKINVKFDFDGRYYDEALDFADIIGAEFEAGNIDDYSEEGEGLIVLDGGVFDYINSRGQYIETKAKRLHFTFSQYLKDLSGEEIEAMLIGYIRANSAEFQTTQKQAA